jgi:hypothetical protein
MAELFQILRWLHIAVGSIALIVFWIPAFAKKGGKLHIRAGWVYVACMGIVVVTAFSMSGLAFTIPMVIRRISQPLEGAALNEFLLRQRIFATFLGYLALVTLAPLWQGVFAIRTRKNPSSMRTPFALFINIAMMLGGFAVVVIGIRYSSGPLIGLSPIGPFLAYGNLRYLLRGPQTRMGWWYEHLVAMIATGIAGYTAFVVFGASRTVHFLQSGPLATFFWVLPTVVGTPAIFIIVAYYRRKFKETGTPRASTGPAPAQA